MKFFNKIVACILCLSIIACFFVGCSNKTELQKQIKYVGLDNYNILPNGIIAENDNFSLEWDADFGCVSLKDKKSDYVWSTTPVDANDKGVDDFGFPILATPAVNSPVTIQYVNPKTLTTEVAYGYSASISQDLFNCELIENGLKVTYYFDDVKIAIPVSYILREDSLFVSVNTSEIQQAEYELFSVSLAPYLCYTNNDDKDSYLYVPSGCGALIYPKALSQTGTRYSEPVYGEDASMQVYDLISTTENILLPIYGSKNKNQGVLTVIEDGAETAYIDGTIGSLNTGYSNIGATFNLRGYDNLIAKTATKKVKSTLYADSLISGNLSLGIYPLKDSNASYNGMINKYREYLISTKQLNANSDIEDSSLHLKILGGQIVKEFFFGVPYKKMFSLTSLNEAKGIIKEVTNLTESNISIEFSGFGQTGMSRGKMAGGYTIADKLGDIKDLKEIQNLCNENNDKLYFDFDLISFAKSGKGWSYFSDLATGPTGLSTYQYQYYLSTRSRKSDAKKVGLLAREKIDDSAEKLIDKISSWNLKGIGIGNLGNLCYSDYSNLSSFAKNNMSEDVNKALKVLKQNDKYNLLANSANLYAACAVDEITDVPLQSSNSDVFDIDIPAYQMLFRGYKSITSAPINSTVDSTAAMLMAIEGGSGISYSVISNYDSSLISYVNNDFHTSIYSDIKDDIESTIKKTSEYYNAIKGAKIVSIELLSSTLHKTVFNNGVEVYVNHGDESVQTDIGQINAKDYLMKESS